MVRVGVVGGGIHGVYATKWCLEEPAIKEVVMFELNPSPGGNWWYRDGPGGVFRHTFATSSKLYMHPCDYPFPPETPTFPHHSDVAKHIERYIEHFNLAPHFRLNHRVTRLVRTTSSAGKPEWIVEYDRVCPETKAVLESGSQTFDRIVFSTGINIPRNVLTTPEYKGFTGEYVHSSQYKFGRPEWDDKNILIVGGGESASDICCELSYRSKLFCSMRTGAWVFDREFGNGAFDVMTARVVWWTGWWRSSLIASFGICLETMFGVGGHGVPEWAPKAPFMRGFFNKSRDIVRAVQRNALQPRRGAIRCEGKKIWFEGREEPDEIDVIIDCSGFRSNFTPLLNGLKTREEVRAITKASYDAGIPMKVGLIAAGDDVCVSTMCGGAKLAETAMTAGKPEPGELSTYTPPSCYSQLFGYVWDPNDTTIAFVGTTRPLFGSFPTIGELQCRWAAKVFGGYPLRDADYMRKDIVKQKELHNYWYPYEKFRPTNVSMFEYTNRISQEFGMRPNFAKMYVTDPRKWWLMMTCPWTPFQYVVNDPRKEEQAMKNLAESYPYGYMPYERMYQGIVVHFVIAHLVALIVLYYAVSLTLSLVW